jgi:hypothetical protein
MFDRRLTRCSRADVIWGLALFVTGQLVLAAAIERWLPELRDPRYACRARKLCARTAAEPKPLTVVMLGSSRVQDGFDSSALEKQLARRFDRPVIVYNFGLPGTGPIANLLHFERLCAANVKPDLLFVEFVPVMLTGPDGVPQEATWYKADRLWEHELAVVERYGVPADALRRDWWQDWPVPCHGHRFAIVSRILPRLLPLQLQLNGDRRIDPSGWQPRNNAPLTADDRRRGLEYSRSGFGVSLQSFRLCEGACRAQRDLLARCREERIPTALVWLPEGEVFRSWYPREAEADIRRFLDELIAELGVPLVDARDWVDDDGFLDGNHLHASGAADFSERLGREVVEPILALPRRQWGDYLATRRRLGESGERPSVARRLEAGGEGRSVR